MSPPTDLRTQIAYALREFTRQPLRAAAVGLFNVLGYASERTLDLGSIDKFIDVFDPEQKNLDRFKPLETWKDIQLVFQLTSGDYRRFRTPDS